MIWYVPQLLPHNCISYLNLRNVKMVLFPDKCIGIFKNVY